MASFMTSKPGMTHGPAGPVHSVKLGEYVLFEKPLSDDERAKLLINMHDHWCMSKENRNSIVREIKRKRYFTDGVLKPGIPRRLFKIMKARYADMLCENGVLGLGPLNYYQKVEDQDIYDKHEGVFIAYAEGEKCAVASVSEAGSHVLLYCTTTEPDARFEGYDACVEIRDPEAFMRATANSVSAHFSGRNELLRVEQSPCVYQHSRIVAGRLSGFSEALIHLGEISVDTIEVLSAKKYLIKETAYASDSEYRIAFGMRTDVLDYTVVECREVIGYCRRVR
jgi:hypothetical protein